METKECKIHGVLPKTSEYFSIQGNCYYCRQCIRVSARKYALIANKNLKDSYVKTKLQQRIKFNTGKYILQKDLDLDLVKLERLSLMQNRSPKYNFENIDFINVRDLSKYIESKYNIKHRTVEWRLRNGYSLDEVIGKRKPFKVKSIRFIVNGIEFTTIREIAKYVSLSYASITCHMYYHSKNVEESVNYLYAKKYKKSTKSFIK